MTRFESLGVLEEITGQKRNRVFRYTPYWRLFQDNLDAHLSETPPQDTVSEGSVPS